MALFIREAEVQQLLSMEDTLAVVEEGIKEQGLGKAVNYPRIRLRADRSTLQVMPASIPGLGASGFKAYGGGRTGGQMRVTLFSTETGDLLAIMEANRLGQMRTGAASGVATKYMARPDAHRVGIFGTGFQARTQLMAVCQVRPISTIKAYGRDPGRRQAFCQEMTQTLGVEVIPVERPEEAARDVDIIITITNTREPVLMGEWLEPGPGIHINAAGANSITRRELDEEAMRRADFVAVDSLAQAKIECGDLLVAVDRGIINWEQVKELGEVVAGIIPGRRSPEEITLFESHGIAIWDVAAAARVYQLAQEKGIGTPLPF